MCNKIHKDKNLTLKLYHKDNNLISKLLYNYLYMYIFHLKNE